jgi:5-formyltetrahydrofolate cyclo-ligase
MSTGNTLAAEKTMLRNAAKLARNALGAEQCTRLSADIVRRLRDLPEYRRGETYFVYISHGAEVHTHGLIDALSDRGKTVLVPRLEAGRMWACEFPGWQSLERGQLGILSPAMDAHVWQGPVDVSIIPGVAFSERGDRLGYGKGYYDRWLADHPESRRLALAYECQLVPAIPCEEHDLPVQIIVSEQRVIHTGR